MGQTVVTVRGGRSLKHSTFQDWFWITEPVMKEWHKQPVKSCTGGSKDFTRKGCNGTFLLFIFFPLNKLIFFKSLTHKAQSTALIYTGKTAKIQLKYRFKFFKVYTVLDKVLSLADKVKNRVELPFNLWVFNHITLSSSADGISLVVMVTDLLAGEHVSVSTSRSSLFSRCYDQKDKGKGFN